LVGILRQHLPAEITSLMKIADALAAKGGAWVFQIRKI